MGLENRTPAEAGVVKRAISLPKSLDGKLRGILAGTGGSYSGLIREAVELYLKSRESRDVEETYARYYSEKETVRKDAELAGEVSGLPWRHWP